MSYYDTLGVSKSATPDEIKKAYRKLASQHHPDKGGDTAKFQQIEEAYRILSDPAQKEQYDNPAPHGFRFNSNDFDGMPPGFDEIFRNFGFGGGSPFGHQRQPRKNKDLRVEISITLAESLTEQQKTLSIQTTNGQRETVTVGIPRGVHDGSSIRYPGLGDTFFNTLPRGDLYIIVRLAPHELFVVNNYDLIVALNIDCFEAMLGTDAEITGVDGKIFMLKVPEGTQNGTMLRVRGEGLYAMNTSNRGNLLVKIEVNTPKHLTENQKELIRKAQSEK